MSEAVKNIKEKECYWMAHPKKIYTLVMIKEIEGKQCIALEIDENVEIEIDIPDCQFYAVNPAAVEDMTSLHYLHEAGILNNLEERSKFHHKTPYTYVANVLIAVNPLQNIPDKAFEIYKSQPISACEPHPYGIAEMAFCQMILPRITNRNQSIVISGESGSGKTETAKIILKYLCWRSNNSNSTTSNQSMNSNSSLSTSTNRDRSVSLSTASNAVQAVQAFGGNAGPGVAASGNAVGSSSSKGYVKMEMTIDNKILQSNPVLEAFGNAKTQRNNNSSRFGKFLKLHFDTNTDYRLASASIETYLLETSRVVNVTDGERNYHIFYQLLLGASPALRRKWHLKEIRSYRYLTQTSEIEVDGVNDVAKFIELVSAFTQLGVTANEQDCIFKSLNGILCLGNIDFDTRHDEEGQESAQVLESYTVDRVAEQLGVDKVALEQCITTKLLDLTSVSSNHSQPFSNTTSSPPTASSQANSGVHAGDATVSPRLENIRSPRNVNQAIYARDSMAKAIYQRIFDWIVGHLSTALNHDPSRDKHCANIGVLDIFGFEDFMLNSLEQLLINYANENLQLIYNNTILVSERELYLNEGLSNLEDSINNTAYQSNISNFGCIELIGIGSKSIISYLDSCCVRAGIDEDIFISLLHKNIKNNDFFPTVNPVDKKYKFKVKHYARNVVYTTGSFIVKNMDIKITELNTLLLSSSFNTKCTLFQMNNTAVLPSTNTSITGANPIELGPHGETSSFDSADGSVLEGSPPPGISRNSRSSSVNSDIGPSAPELRSLKTRSLRITAIDASHALALGGNYANSPMTLPLSSPLLGSTPSMKSISNAHSGQHKSIATTFIRRMNGLNKVLEASKCSFIRCIKPNSAMTPGNFERSYVIEQLRCLGVVQTCEILKVGLPTRINISDLEAMYRPLLPEKLQTILSKFYDASFVKAIVWAFALPHNSYKIGKTKVFFRIGKISLLNEITEVQMDSEKGMWLAKRLCRYVQHVWWRKIVIKQVCNNAWIQLLLSVRQKKYCVSLIQRKWKLFYYSSTKIRQRYIRKKWRIAILKVRCSNVLLQEYQLIHESTKIRMMNELMALKHIDALEEAQHLREQELAYENAMIFEQDQVQMQLQSQEDSSELDAGEDGDGGGDELGELPTSRISTSGMMGGVGSSNISGINSIMSSSSTHKVPQRSLSIAAMTDEEEKLKNEMKALVAASNLATVSVSLFRWTKIKLFAAFETWLQMLPTKSKSSMIHNRGRVQHANNANVASSALNGGARLVQNDQDMSPLLEDQELKQYFSEDVYDKNSSTLRSNAEDTDVSSVATTSSHDVQSHINNAGVTTANTVLNGDIVQSPNGSSANVVKRDNDKMRRSISFAMLFQSTEYIDITNKCYECMMKSITFYCSECDESYCKICTQFVHNSCRHMKLHHLITIANYNKAVNEYKLQIGVIDKASTRNGDGGDVNNDASNGGDSAVVSHVKRPSRSSISKLFNQADTIDFDDLNSNSNNNNINSNNTQQKKSQSNQQSGRRSLSPTPIVASQSMITSIELETTRRHSIRRRPSNSQSFHTMGMTKSMSIANAGAGGNSNANAREGNNAGKNAGDANVENVPMNNVNFEPCAIKSCNKSACKGVSIRFCEEHYEEFRASMKNNKENSEEHDTLQKQVALLKKQLQESGQQPVEFFELSVAREKMQQAVQRLMGGDESAEKDIERYDKSIRMNPEYQKEMEEKAKQWEIDQKPINESCILKMRNVLPPNVASTSVTQMIADGLPKSIATRFWTKKALWLINTHPEDIKKIHIVDLQTKFGNNGLDIIEMRAIWYNLPPEFENDGDGKKLEWRKLFRQKLEELSAKEANNRLSAMEKRNPAYKGHDNLVVYDCNVEIKRAAIQKSTAFDATEKPAMVSSTVGDTIKDIKKPKPEEKPHHEGNLSFISGGSANADGPILKVYGVLLLQKKLLTLYTNPPPKEISEETPAPPPVKEIPILKNYQIKVGPGNKSFSILEVLESNSNPNEVILFETDKMSREKWITTLNEVIVLANKAPLVKKHVEEEEKVDAVVASSAVTEEVNTPPPRPSGMLAGILGKKKPPITPSENSNGTDGSDAPPPKPAGMLAGISAAGLKKRAPAVTADPSAGGDSDSKPAAPMGFLAGIAAKKKQEESAESGENKPAAPMGFLAGIAAKKKQEESGETSSQSASIKRSARVSDVI